MYQVFDRKNEIDAWSDEKSALSSNSSQSNDYHDDPTNLIVNYLPTHFQEEDLRKLFEGFGTIESLIVMYNKHDYRKKSKGYGFVKFSAPEEAKAAIEAVDGRKISNKTIKVSVARPGRQRRSSNVFVSRLPIHWKTKDLQSAFEQFGHIVESRVLTFGDGVSRRCGFVRYDSDDQAKQAMMKMRNYRPSPSDAPLQVNLSVNHNSDAKQFEDQKPVFDWNSNHRIPPWMSREEFLSSLRGDSYQSPFACPEELQDDRLLRALRDFDPLRAPYRGYRDPAYLGLDPLGFRDEFRPFRGPLIDRDDTFKFTSPEPVSLLRHNAPVFQPVQPESTGTQEPVQNPSPPKSFSGGGSLADELKKLNDLRNQGILSDDEFAQAKQKLLA